jgi:hypothetical protein
LRPARQANIESRAQGARAVLGRRSCPSCRREFIPERPNKTCCSSVCRAALSRSKRSAVLEMNLRSALAAVERGDVAAAAEMLRDLLAAGGSL